MASEAGPRLRAELDKLSPGVRGDYEAKLLAAMTGREDKAELDRLAHALVLDDIDAKMAVRNPERRRELLSESVQEATRHRVAIAIIWLGTLRVEEMIAHHNDQRTLQMMAAMLLVALTWPGRKSWWAYGLAAAGLGGVVAGAFMGITSPPIAAVLVLVLAGAGQWFDREIDP